MEAREWTLRTQNLYDFGITFERGGEPAYIGPCLGFHKHAIHRRSVVDDMSNRLRFGVHRSSQSIRQCKIWEIALHCPLTKKDLQIVVDPDPSCKTFDPPPSKDLFHLTRAFLRKQNAEIFGSAFLKVQEFVDEQLRATNRAVALMISHNTFKSDKPLLEVECAKAGLPTPIHWYFFDSLHYFRKHPRCRSLKNFSLGSVSQHPAQ